MRYLLNKGRCDSPTPFYLSAALMFIAIVTLNVFLFKTITKDNGPFKGLTNSSESNIAKPLPDNLLSLEKVRGLANTDSPNNEITGVQLEQRNGQLVFVVTLASGKKLAFDAQSGVRVADTTYDGLPKEKTLPAAIDASVDFEMAREVAIRDKPEGEVEKIELSQEGNTVVYSVYFADKSRTDIASDGTILRTESVTTPEPPSDSPPELPPATEPSQPSGGTDITPLLENSNNSDDDNPAPIGTF